MKRRRRQREQTLGDAPVEEAYHDRMRVVARAIDHFFNGEPPAEKKTGFVIMVFDFGTGPGRCNYMSNASREDVVTLLKEQLARFEGQPEMKGSA
jgi:hypothetical protein